jgi:hypothetical protein
MAETEDRRPAQRRNTYSFLVTWPEGTEPPMGCPQSYRVWYGTEKAADLAADGYRTEGAQVS